MPKHKSTKLEHYQLWMKVCMFCIAIFGIFAILSTLGYNFFSNRIKEINEQSAVNTKTTISVNDTQKHDSIVQSKRIDTIKEKGVNKKSVENAVMPINKPKITEVKETDIQIKQTGKNNIVVQGDNKGNINVGDTYNSAPLQRHV